jgi:hypothetical protein
MMIRLDFSALKTVKPSEYVTRFVFGGLVTVFAGLVAKFYGPVIGGLFLAVPAIFPATVTLIEKHEKQKKQRAGYEGTNRGRSAASVEAAGTSLGAIGLICFGLILWRFLPTHSAWLILPVAGCCWLAVATLLWVLRKRF